MNYNLYLKYDDEQDLNINDDRLSDGMSAYILYESEEAVNKAPDNPKRTTIGFLSMKYYNQALAMAYEVDMTELTLLRLRINSKALLELDYRRISQETVDEIGAATNPNILILFHFGISAAWRNKGIGEQVMKGLIKQMKGRCGYIIILKSQPQQHAEYTAPDSQYMQMGVDLESLEKDPEKAQWKLNAFWQRCGFRRFKNYDDVFICNVEKAAVGRWEASLSAI